MPQPPAVAAPAIAAPAAPQPAAPSNNILIVAIAAVAGFLLGVLVTYLLLRR